MGTVPRLRAYLARRPLLFDALLAAGLTVVGLVGLWIVDGPLRTAYVKLGIELPGPAWAWYVCMIVMGLSVAARRRYPLSALVVSVIAFGLFRVLKAPESLVSSVLPFITLYSAGAYDRRRRSVLVRALCLLAFAGVLAWGLADLATSLDDRGLSAGEREGVVAVESSVAVLFNLIFFLAAWLLGDAVRRRREREAELAERAAELERANAVIAEQAVLDERLRIARELHDVVAHHVSVIGIQAGAARKVLGRSPDRAAELIGAVEESSRQTVGELHQLLGFLRREPDGAVDGRQPQPTLAELDALLDRMRVAGLDIRFQVDGEIQPLPAAVELSAYRIVQEALTNTLKHAGPRAWVAVDLAHRPGELGITVRDTGRRNGSRPAVPPRPGGRGLIGMRERAGVHGGTLDAGPRPGGGYEVRATIPV